MPLARIRFGRARKRDFDAADHAAHGYLASLLHNGQIHEYFLSSTGGRFQACAEIPRRDSLDWRHCPSRAADDLKKLIEVFGRKPEITLLDRAPAKPSSSWRRAKSFYLHPMTFDHASPVYSPEIEEPVPLYLLPLKPGERGWIHSWAEDYRAYERLWFGSGPLVNRVHRELADPRSHLARQGRKLCAMIEKATGKPTYLYLLRYYGHRSGEEKRPCPNCGRRWAVKSWEDPEGGFSDFFFRCERCRLVSHAGISLEGERLARIGEFREGSRRRR